MAILRADVPSSWLFPVPSVFLLSLTVVRGSFFAYVHETNFPVLADLFMFSISHLLSEFLNSIVLVMT